MPNENNDIIIAALCVRPDSAYFSIPGVDCWTESRDCRLWPGGAPIVAHPPSASWGRLRRQARQTSGHDLAPMCIAKARAFGGVVDHPEGSALWAELGLPRPGAGRDAFGGWTLAAPQYWYGGHALQRRWFYIVGVEPRAVAIPLVLGTAPKVVTAADRKRPELQKSARDRTPPALAAWLVDLARSVKLR